VQVQCPGKSWKHVKHTFGSGMSDGRHMSGVHDPKLSEEVCPSFEFTEALVSACTCSREGCVVKSNSGFSSLCANVLA